MLFAGLKMKLDRVLRSLSIDAKKFFGGWLQKSYCLAVILDDPCQRAHITLRSEKAWFAEPHYAELKLCSSVYGQLLTPLCTASYSPISKELHENPREALTWLMRNAGSEHLIRFLFIIFGALCYNAYDTVKWFVQ